MAYATATAKAFCNTGFSAATPTELNFKLIQLIKF